MTNRKADIDSNMVVITIGNVDGWTTRWSGDKNNIRIPISGGVRSNSARSNWDAMQALFRIAMPIG